MNTSASKDLIDNLRKGNFYAECPNCGNEISLKNAGLFDENNFTNEALKYYQEQLQLVKDRKESLKRLKEQGAIKSETGAKSTNIGFILERLAPTMKGFRFNHNDCRSLFDPIDYIIFEGLSLKGKIDKLFFVDIKTGSARLSKKQKEIKNIISAKKINFIKY